MSPTNLSAAVRDSKDDDTIAAQNLEQSPLLRLPGELRNKMYGYVLSVPYIDVESKYCYQRKRYVACMPDHQDNLDDIADNEYYVSEVQPFSLLFVRRQLHHEVVPLLYTLNYFRFDLRDASVFVRNISENARNSITTMRTPRIDQDSDYFQPTLSMLTALPNLEVAHFETSMPKSNWMPFEESVGGMKAALLQVTGRDIRLIKVHGVEYWFPKLM